MSNRLVVSSPAQRADLTNADLDAEFISALPLREEMSRIGVQAVHIGPATLGPQGPSCPTGSGHPVGVSGNPFYDNPAQHLN